MEGAHLYAAWRDKGAAGRANEAARCNELILQSRFVAGDFGSDFLSDGKTRVRILRMGRWNREPGPDILGAVLLFGENERVVADIELDWSGDDWFRHGHAASPRFEGVGLHVVFEQGNRPAVTASGRTVPRVLLPLDGVAEFPAPSLDASLPMEVVTRMVRMASEHRLQRKAISLAAAAEIHGTDNALCQASAASLGYKANAAAMLALAQRVSITEARSDRGEALLFGVAGFLETDFAAAAEGEARRYVRSLWEAWWTLRGDLQRLILPRGAWTFVSSRPLNHPHRRVAALHGITAAWEGFHRSLHGSFSEMLEVCRSVSHLYWDSHWSLSSRRSSEPQALLGRARALEIAANVAEPWRVSRTGAASEEYFKLPAGELVGSLRSLAAELVGSSAMGRRLLRKLANVQGLLELRRDLARGCSIMELAKVAGL